MDLSVYARNYHSQFGEDGIIEKVFELLPTQEQYHCVEFGAWDGIKFSNTHHLISTHDWHGLMIEGDKKRFSELQSTYSNNPKAKTINRWVDFEGRDSLDAILKEHELPHQFDLLSIDVDGMDYHIWEALHAFEPKLVVIEFNQTIPLDISFVQEKDRTINHGNSLLALLNLAKNKGYELIATTHNNAFFIHHSFYPTLGIIENSLETIRKEHIEAPRVFQLYDGSLRLTSKVEMLWKDRMVSEDELQVFSKTDRTFAGKPSLFKRLSHKIKSLF